MATKVKKPPPLKKRHTKPCKFFQLGRCPLRAEECNFAHVFAVPGVNPLSGSPSVYYTTGPVNSPAPAYDRSPTHDMNRVAAQLSRLQVGNPSPVSPASQYSPEYAYPLTSPYSAYPPYYPSSWPPPTNHYGGDELKFQPISMSTMHADSSDSASTSLSADSELHIVTEDPQFSEHSHILHQSRTRIVERGEIGAENGSRGRYVHLNPPPPWDTPAGHYSLGSSAYGHPGESSTLHGAPLTRTSSIGSRGSRSSSMSKYRTKPCKYFNTEKGCSSGDKCRFIHDTIPPVPAIRVRSRSRSPTSLHDPDFPNTDADPMPSKVDRKTEEERKKVDKDRSREKEQSQEDGENNKQGPKKKFWRVIGGGVLMGSGGNKGQVTGASVDVNENMNIGREVGYDAADLNGTDDGRGFIDTAVGEDESREERLRIGEVGKKRKAYVRLRPRSLDITFPRVGERR